MEKTMNLPNSLKKITVEVSRILLGAVFLFSGFVKAVDPLGGAYKNHDYFTAFGLDFLDFLSLPLSFVQTAFEFALGLCLLLGVYRRFHSILTLLFMLVMTPLTLYLALKNPVTDCGCFGDALVITNWETFYKNIVLLAAAIAVFIWYNKMTPLFSKHSSWLVTLYAYLFVLALSFHCFAHLPILDFRPYKIGANIPELMKIPEGAPHDEYATTFIYSKNGVEKEFTLENYPANDSSWTFVDSKSKLIKKGYEPPIHNFTITNPDQVEITDVILADTSYTFLLISHDLTKADDSDVDDINEIYDFSRQYGYSFYGLTSSSPESVTRWVENTGAEYPFYITDEITLKTIIRSNPGLMLIKNGVIINKWPHGYLPVDRNFDKPLSETEWGQIPENHDTRNVFMLVLILILPLGLLFLLDFFRYRKNKNLNI